jgi:hypothetical protein
VAVQLVAGATAGGITLTVHTWPPGLEVTLYEVIADPPFDPGALQVKFAEVFAGVPAALVGAPVTETKNPPSAIAHPGGSDTGQPRRPPDITPSSELLPSSRKSILASVKMALLKLTPLTLARDRSAPDRSAPDRSAPIRSASIPARYPLASLQPEGRARGAPVRPPDLTPRRSAEVKSVPAISAPVRTADIRFREVKFKVERFAFVRSALGPRKYPPRKSQGAGTRLGVPVIPPEWIPSKVAASKSVESMLAPVKLVLVKFVCANDMPDRFVFSRFAKLKLHSNKDGYALTLVRSSPLKSER